jgi:outer membrane protein
MKNYKLKINMIPLKHYALVFVIACLVTKTKAQTPSSAYSLQQAIDYALKNSPSAQNAENDIIAAKYKKKEFQGIGLPQVNASFDIKDFFKIPVSVLPNFVSPAVYGGLVAAGAAPYDPSKLEASSYDPIQAQFGTKYQANASASFSQLLFSSDYIVGLQAAKQLEIISKINATRSKADVVAGVSKAYYTVLVNKERLGLLNANITRFKKLFDDTKEYNKQGFVELIDVERLEVTYNNLLVEKEKVERLLTLGDAVLKFQMGYTGKDALELSDALPSQFTDETLDASKIEATNRPEYKLLQSAQTLNELSLKRQKLGYLPSLVAYGSLGYSALRQKFDIFEGKKDWFPTALIGGTFSLNIFDGFQRHNRIQQAKIDVTKNSNNLKQIQQVVELETTSAVVMYNNAVSSVKTQTRNKELASHVQEVSQKKYQQGLGSNIEVINAETSLKEAQTNYFSAVYDAIIAKIDYQKALGTLVK